MILEFIMKYQRHIVIDLRIEKSRTRVHVAYTCMYSYVYLF